MVASKPRGIDLQARVGQIPQFREALPPRVDVGRVVDDQRAARLVDVKTAHTVGIVREQVRVGKMAQVVGALPHVDHVREAGDDVHQAWRLPMQGPRVMQHDADSPQAIAGEEVRERLKPCVVVQLQAAQVAIEDQQLALGPAQDRIACLAIFGFAGE